MKLEVGQFVKLKSGYICKIININDFREPNMKYGVEANYLKDVMFIGDDDAVKASYNIIDLIEVGDYVNGSKVVNINYDLNYDADIVESITIFDYSIEGNGILHNEEIKSIVTKEQMEQIAYKVEE